MTKYLENLSSTNSLVPFNKSFQGQKKQSIKNPDESSVDRCGSLRFYL